MTYILIVQTERQGEWVTEKWKNHNYNGPEVELGLENFYAPEFTAEYDVYRDYDVFAILAGVRNYLNLTPIAERRGFPDGVLLSPDDDACISVDGEEVWLGDHSHSWLTYEELANPVYWLNTTLLNHYVSQQESARILREGGTPKSWVSSLDPETARELTEEQMRARIFASVEEQMLYVLASEEVTYYSKMEWEEPYTHFGRQLHNKLLPELAALKAQDGVQDVRIVFGFDS